MPIRIKMKGSKSRGFTFVELLVVIGMIALLISILMPALSVFFNGKSELIIY